MIGQVRGKGLFQGAELVKIASPANRWKKPKLPAVVADCLKQGVMIGRTNRAVPGLNNTLCLSPALICTKGRYRRNYHGDR